MCVYHILFIPSSVDEHLGCFHVLDIVNSASMNIGVHVSLEIRVFIFCRYVPRQLWVSFWFLAGLRDPESLCFKVNIPFPTELNRAPTVACQATEIVNV